MGWPQAGISKSLRQLAGFSAQGVEPPLRKRQEDRPGGGVQTGASSVWKYTKGPRHCHCVPSNPTRAARFPPRSGREARWEGGAARAGRRPA